MSLSAKERQSMETIENAKAQLEESRVYLLRIQASEYLHLSPTIGARTRKYRDHSWQCGPSVPETTSK